MVPGVAQCYKMTESQQYSIRRSIETYSSAASNGFSLAYVGFQADATAAGFWQWLHVVSGFAGHFAVIPAVACLVNHVSVGLWSASLANLTRPTRPPIAISRGRNCTIGVDAISFWPLR